MRKLRNYAILMLTALAAFACGTDEETKPVPAISGKNFNIADTLKAKAGEFPATVILVEAEEKVETLTVKVGTTTFDLASKDTPDSVYTALGLPTGGVKGETSVSVNLTAVLNAIAVPGVISAVVDITDKNEASLSATLVAEVLAPVEPYIFTEFTTVLLGANKNATEASFLDLNDGKKYSIADAKAVAEKIDLLYFYGSSNKATLASPSDSDSKIVYNSATSGLQTWSKLNATTVKVVTADFAGLTPKSVMDLAKDGMTATKANDLAKDNVLVYKLESGEVGAISVSEIVVGNEGTITIDVKAVVPNPEAAK